MSHLITNELCMSPPLTPFDFLLRGLRFAQVVPNRINAVFIVDGSVPNPIPRTLHTTLPCPCYPHNLLLMGSIGDSDSGILDCYPAEHHTSTEEEPNAYKQFYSLLLSLIYIWNLLNSKYTGPVQVVTSNTHGQG